MLYLDLFNARTFLLGMRVRIKTDTFVNGKNVFLVCDRRPSFIPKDFVHLFQRKAFRFWNLRKDEFKILYHEVDRRILTKNKTNRPPRRENV